MCSYSKSNLKLRIASDYQGFSRVQTKLQYVSHSWMRRTVLEVHFSHLFSPDFGAVFDFLVDD